MPGGRPKGSTKAREIAEAIRVALKRKSEGDPEGRTKLFVLADKLVDLACEGDVQAMKEVADRIDGKAAQPIEHSGQVETSTTHYVADRSRTLTELLDASEGSAEPGDSSGESERLH